MLAIPVTASAARRPSSSPAIATTRCAGPWRFWGASRCRVIIGKGSNLLVADDGYPGAVISLGREFSRFVLADDGVTITAGAGAMLARLVNEALSRELSGLEFAVGIPGTVGGAISMNAGSRDEWIGALVQDVLTYKAGEGIRHYGRDDVTWGYRTNTLPRDEIVLRLRRLPPRQQGRYQD